MPAAPSQGHAARGSGSTPAPRRRPLSAAGRVTAGTASRRGTDGAHGWVSAGQGLLPALSPPRGWGLACAHARAICFALYFNTGRNNKAALLDLAGAAEKGARCCLGSAAPGLGFGRRSAAGGLGLPGRRG